MPQGERIEKVERGGRKCRDARLRKAGRRKAEKGERNQYGGERRHVQDGTVGKDHRERAHDQGVGRLKARAHARQVQVLDPEAGVLGQSEPGVPVQEYGAIGGGCFGEELVGVEEAAFALVSQGGVEVRARVFAPEHVFMRAHVEHCGGEDQRQPEREKGKRRQCPPALDTEQPQRRKDHQAPQQCSECGNQISRSSAGWPGISKQGLIKGAALDPVRNLFEKRIAHIEVAGVVGVVGRGLIHELSFPVGDRGHEFIDPRDGSALG